MNTAYFAWSDPLELYFLSHPRSQHCRNLEASTTMAVAVFECPQTWGELDRGLQLFGTGREARGASARTAEQAYGRRFTAYGSWKKQVDQQETEWEYRFYRFVTRRVKVFDEREFGSGVFITAAVNR